MNTKLFVMALGLAMMASCSDKKEEGADAKMAGPGKPEVKLAVVQSESIPQTDTYTATVESDVKNNIAPNAPLRIENILVEVGDRVSKGQCVVKLDASNLQQLQLQISNQNAVLKNTQTDFKRIEELFKIGGVSQAEYDMAQVQLESQQTQLNVLKTQLAQLSQNTQLFSPISGVVTARNYDNGDMYSGAMPVLTIEQTNPVKLMVKISEKHYKDVQKGQPVDITLDAYPGEAFTGKVTIITPNVDPVTHTFPVEVTINNSDQKVRPGMFARATINFGSLDHVLIPDEALVKQIGAGDRYVYVYDKAKGTVSYNKVELGRHIGDNYEIFSGVNPGDQVVVAGQARLNNGKEVEVVK